MASRAWLASIVALGASAMGLWHLLLLKLYLDSPLAVASFLSVVFGQVLLTRALVLGPRSAAPRAVQRGWQRLDAPNLFWVAFFLLLVFLFHWGFQRAASDGREYFVQVRSLVIDGDLDFGNENASFGVRGTANIYAFGAPLLWAPFFLAARLWFGLLNLAGGTYPLDGFANPYQRAVGLASLVYGFAGLMLIHGILRNYFSRGLAAVTTVAVCCGSFLIWYFVVESSMVHGVSLFATTLFLYLWQRTRDRRTLVQWSLLGAAAGMMSMVRWQNMLFAIVPVAIDLVGPWRSTTKDRFRMLARGGVFVASALLAFLPQLVFWRYVRGEWVSVPTGDHGVQWMSLHVGDVLFSSNHGLLSWTPLVYIALIGLPLFLRRDPRLGVVLLAGFGAQVYVNSSVDNWWGGSGFGARRFDNCALAFAVGLASLLDWLKRSPLVAPMAIVGTLVAGNTLFMLDVRSNALPAGEGISFDRVLQSFYRRVGNPFSFPLSAYIAWKYDAGMSLYDRLRGRTYSNVTIDLGEGDDELFLGNGWSSRERAPAHSFRWTAGQESTVIVPLRRAADYELELVCAPFLYPGAPRQVVEVLVNGTSVAKVGLDKGMRAYRVRVPADAVRRDLNLLRFRYAYAASPRAVGLSDDTRHLAVQFDALRLRQALDDSTERR